jgi:hypothetical protein
VHRARYRFNHAGTAGSLGTYAISTIATIEEYGSVVHLAKEEMNTTYILRSNVLESNRMEY